MDNLDGMFGIFVRGAEDELLERLPSVRNLDCSVDGITLLGRAARKKFNRAVKLMLEMGADPNYQTDECHPTPLGQAAHGDAITMKLLLDAGADPKIGRPLISAVSQGNLGAVRMLVQAGTNINAIYDDSFTALGFAEQYEETEIIEYLHSLGALGSREALKKRKAERPSLLGRLASRFGFNQTETENSELICEFFEDRFCQSRPLDLPEMFGSKPRFDVHIIYPSAICKNIVLFTKGLSGKRAQRYFPKVELYLELCPEWPSPAEDPAGAWPLEWLVNIGEQVIKSKSGFDGNYVVVANGDPPTANAYFDQ